MGRKNIDEKTIRTVTRTYEDTRLTIKDISKQTGVPVSSIYWILSKAGISPDRRNRARQLREAVPDPPADMPEHWREWFKEYAEVILQSCRKENRSPYGPRSKKTP